MLVLDPASRCDVCLDSYSSSPPTQAYVIPCGHVFCRTCLMSVHPAHCPLCRKTFLPDRIKKLHVDPPDSNHQNIEAAQETDLLQRLSLSWGDEAPVDSQVGQEVASWLAHRDANMSLPLRRALSGIAKYHQVKRLCGDAEKKAADLERNNMTQLATQQQDANTAQQIETTLLAQIEELKEEAASLKTQLTTAQAEITVLQAPRRHNPLPDPPVLVEYNPPPIRPIPTSSSSQQEPWIPWKSTSEPTPAPPVETSSRPGTRYNRRGRVPYAIYRDPEPPATASSIVPGPAQDRWVVPGVRETDIVLTGPISATRSITPPGPNDIRNVTTRIRRSTQHIRRQSDSHLAPQPSSPAVAFPPHVAQMIRDAAATTRPPTVPPNFQPSAAESNNDSRNTNANSYRPSTGPRRVTAPVVASTSSAAAPSARPTPHHRHTSLADVSVPPTPRDRLANLLNVNMNTSLNSGTSWGTPFSNHTAMSSDVLGGLRGLPPPQRGQVADNSNGGNTPRLFPETFSTHPTTMSRVPVNDLEEEDDESGTLTPRAPLRRTYHSASSSSSNMSRSTVSIHSLTTTTASTPSPVSSSMSITPTPVHRAESAAPSGSNARRTRRSSTSISHANHIHRNTPVSASTSTSRPHRERSATSSSLWYQAVPNSAPATSTSTAPTPVPSTPRVMRSTPSANVSNMTTAASFGNALGLDLSRVPTVITAPTPRLPARPFLRSFNG